MFGVDDAIGAGLDLAGSIINGDNGSAQNQANYEHQKEFAQHGIQWKVEDAKAAGLSPLAALGAVDPSFSPSTPVGDGFGDFLSREGQDLSRAASASQSKPTQDELLAQKHQHVMDNLDEQKGHLQLELLKHQIANMTQQPGIPDAFEKVRMPDGTILQVPGKDLAVSAFMPWQNQGLGAYSASLGIGNYLTGATMGPGLYDIPGITPIGTLRSGLKLLTGR